MQPAISVIVPVYKSERYLSKCIESILKQTFQAFELILVDDGSPDSSPIICDEYAQKDSRIKVIHKSNGGVSSARNEGIIVAKGEYITFVDSDDYIDIGFLNYAYKKVKEYSADLFVSGIQMENWGESKIDKINIYKISEEKCYKPVELLESWGQSFPPICMCGPWCKLYRNETLTTHSILFDEALDCGEDTYFNLGVLSKIERIYFSEKIFYHYRREGTDSLFSRFHRNTYELHSKVYSRQKQLMEELQCSKHAMRRFKNQYFGMLIGGMHEYYRFYDLNTKEERLALAQKIAMDEQVKNCKIGEIKKIKNKILILLLKAKKYNIFLFIFDKYYKK